MAHLASVRPLIDAALAARAHQLVGETPLLLAQGGWATIFTLDRCMHFVRQKRRKLVITITQSGSDWTLLNDDKQTPGSQKIVLSNFIQTYLARWAHGCSNDACTQRARVRELKICLPSSRWHLSTGA